MNVTGIVQSHLPYIQNKFYSKMNVDKRDGLIFHSNVKTYLTENKNKFYGEMYNYFVNFRRDFLENGELTTVVAEHPISYKNINGKLDALFKNKEGKNILVEWKTTTMDYVGFGFGVSNVTKNIRNCNYHRAILQLFIYKNMLERNGSGIGHTDDINTIDEIWVVYFNSFYSNRGGFCISKVNINSEFNDIANKILDGNCYFTQNILDIRYENRKISELTSNELSLFKNYLGQGSLTLTHSFIINFINTNQTKYRYLDDFEIMKDLIKENEYSEYSHILNLINIPEVSNAVRLHLFHNNLCVECCNKPCKKLHCRTCIKLV